MVEHTFGFNTGCNLPTWRTEGREEQKGAQWPHPVTTPLVATMTKTSGSNNLAALRLRWARDDIMINGAYRVCDLDICHQDTLLGTKCLCTATSGSASSPGDLRRRCAHLRPWWASALPDPRTPGRRHGRPGVGLSWLGPTLQRAHDRGQPTAPRGFNKVILQAACSQVST